MRCCAHIRRAVIEKPSQWPPDICEFWLSIHCCAAGVRTQLVPLVPWFFTGGTRAAVASLALGGAAALAVGGVLSYLGGRNPLWGAVRQLLALCAAAGATWGAGKLFHVTVT